MSCGFNPGQLCLKQNVFTNSVSKLLFTFYCVTVTVVLSQYLQGLQVADIEL